MNARMKSKEYVATPGEVEDIVLRFSNEITKELGELVKSVVWFGSAVRRHFAEGKKSLRDEALFGSDIDIMILFDDMVNVLTPEVITAYRIVTEKTAANVSKRLHITTMPVTKFWDYCMKGDPIMINMLRDGNAMFDAGCFGMAKSMLSSRMIAPGEEVVWIYLGRGPMSVSNAHWNMKQAVIDLHWSVFDAAHSALLHYGIVPDTPEHLVPLVQHHLVGKGMIHKKYASLVAEFMNIGRMLMSGETSKVKGDSYDRYRKEANEFLHVVRELIASK
ncbi:nucleotidyltransferase domain-containing protein [Candidatus Woesearchaeota archaeon]|nr:nucleotidyltransferase domain-containing protein [Candidatus Woesearchaeota archaeon]